MARLYHVSLRFEVIPTSEDIPKLEAQFSEIGDWMRFSALSWLVSSRLNPTQIRDKLRLTLKPADHLLVLEVNTTGADGWALPWVWEWIRSRSS